MTPDAELHLKVRGVALWLKTLEGVAPYVAGSAFDTLLLAADELARRLPAGWALVPIEPTQEMIDACPMVEDSEDVKWAWAALLRAAAQPPP